MFTHLDPTLPYVVAINTSEVGVIADLSQRTHPDNLLPVSFQSRKFSPAKDCQEIHSILSPSIMIATFSMDLSFATLQAETSVPARKLSVPSALVPNGLPEAHNSKTSIILASRRLTSWFPKTCGGLLLIISCFL